MIMIIIAICFVSLLFALMGIAACINGAEAERDYNEYLRTKKKG
jgi:hypothetical protein